MPSIKGVADATFAAFHGVYDRPTTYQHWQLRDLVHCGDVDHLVYCVYHTQIVQYDVLRNQSTVVKDLPFKPTSLTVAQGYIAAGGERSQLYVARLSDMQQVFDNCVGGTVNNSLNISTSTAGDLRLFVCNNDNSIKIYQLHPTFLRPISQIRCPVAINYAALSEDATHLVAVGDSRDTYLYRARPEGYERVGCYRETEEPAMSCAWNAPGTCFAVASQEGRVVVWDHRSGKVVSRFHTGEACRSVKFSCAPVDLLAFSEQRDWVHLVDSRCYGSKQSFRAVPIDGEQNISGIAFTPEGGQLYVGVEEGLALFDINVRSRRAFPWCDTI